MIYPRQRATVWIMSREGSLFCFNGVLWKAGSHFSAAATCAVSEAWQQVRTWLKHMQSEHVFPGRSSWKWHSYGHQWVLCQGLHKSSCKTASNAQLLFHWTVNLYICALLTHVLLCEPSGARCLHGRDWPAFNFNLFPLTGSMRLVLFPHY